MAIVGKCAAPALFKLASVAVFTPEQASYLRGQRYNREKGPRGGSSRVNPSSENKNWGGERTNERLAKEYKVSHDTINNDGKFAAAVEKLAEAHGPEIKQRCRGAVSAIEIIVGMVRLTLQRDHRGHVVLLLVRGDQWHVLARSSYPCNHHPSIYRRWLREVRRLDRGRW